VNTATPATLDRKAERLRQILAGRARLIVAYSGGVDSAFLAWMAHQVLGPEMVAVIADSASLARTHLEDALAFARQREIPVEVVETLELQNPAYTRNDAMRDFRPGQQAARQHRVLAPLLEAALDKSEVRELARRADLRVWDKPASACLSSRLEYGRAVTPEALHVIEQGEDALRAMGFRQFRVRHHGEIVRIEIAPEELPRALTSEMAREFTTVFKRLGFKFVTLDLEGFRSGSMNQLLTAEQLLRGRI
jgi:pyridinium-3,5-biscarboxylic acid mononucleotide sulfurtransferase